MVIIFASCYFVLLSLVKESKEHKVKDLLENVDSEGSTLLHLAVDSGSLKVSLSQPKKMPLSEKNEFIVCQRLKHK